MDNHLLTATAKSVKYCFSYIRFSSSRQAAGDSLRRQMEIAPRVAKEKGWILRDDLCAQSLGLSAYKGSNLQTIEGIITAAKSGKIPKGTVMILEALDRLTRIALDDAYDLFRRLVKAGIEIYTDRTGRHMTEADLDNPMSLMMTIVELDAGFQYSDKLSDRVGKAWKTKKARAADGVVLTTMAPAWLDVDKATNKFKENGKADIVRRIFSSYVNGKGIRTVMRELNAEKISPFGKGKQNRGAGWSNTHTRRILGFRGVIGEYQPCNRVNGKRVPCGEPVSDYYPAIVSEAMFHKAQEILEKQSRKGGSKRNATNLFTGIVKCAKCGSSMVIKRSPCQGGKYYYVSLVCSNAQRGNGCSFHSIQYNWVERAVLTTIWSLVVPEMNQNDERKDKLVKLQGNLKDAQTQIKKWMQVIEESDAPPAGIGNKIHALETKETALKNQIERLSAIIQDNPLASWQHVEPTIDNRLRLQGILADEIESLAVDADKLTATLTLQNGNGVFEMAWDSARRANQIKKSAGSQGFMMLGKKFDYLDQLLVWKSALNLDIQSVLTAFVPDGEPIMA